MIRFQKTRLFLKAYTQFLNLYFRNSLILAFLNRLNLNFHRCNSKMFIKIFLAEIYQQGTIFFLSHTHQFCFTRIAFCKNNSILDQNKEKHLTLFLVIVFLQFFSVENILDGHFLYHLIFPT